MKLADNSSMFPIIMISVRNEFLFYHEKLFTCIRNSPLSTMKDFPNKMEIASSVSFKDVDNRNVITTVEQVKIERIELHFELILIDMEDNDQWQIKSKGISQLTFNDLLALTEIEHKTSNIENKRIFEKERKFNMSFLLHLRFFLFFLSSLLPASFYL